MNRRLLGLSALALISLALAAAPDEDEDDRRERDARVAQVVRDNCLICHSDEMVSTQRLTPAQWQAEVDKMIGWGAPVPKEQAGPLVEYLSRTYPVDAPRVAPARIGYAAAVATIEPERGVATAGDPRRGAVLYAQQCATCHGSLAHGADLGPNLVTIPVLLRPTDFAEVTRNGRRRMPGFRATVDPAGEADLLAWLRGLSP